MTAPTPKDTRSDGDYAEGTAANHTKTTLTEDTTTHGDDRSHHIKSLSPQTQTTTTAVQNVTISHASLYTSSHPSHSKRLLTNHRTNHIRPAAGWQSERVASEAAEGRQT